MDALILIQITRYSTKNKSYKKVAISSLLITCQAVTHVIRYVTLLRRAEVKWQIRFLHLVLFVSKGF